MCTCLIHRSRARRSRALSTWASLQSPGTARCSPVSVLVSALLNPDQRLYFAWPSSMSVPCKLPLGLRSVALGSGWCRNASQKTIVFVLVQDVHSSCVPIDPSTSRVLTAHISLLLCTGDSPYAPIGLLRHLRSFVPPSMSSG